MELKGSKTEANLQAAFAGESMARNKYTYYASQAKKEGYEQIADIFLETAENEKEHAKLWFKALHDNKVPKTIENLKDAASGENYEYTTMYKEFAETAREEGDPRAEVPRPPEEHRDRCGLQEGQGHHVEMPQLRIHPRRRGGSRSLPRLQARPVLLRGQGHQLVIFKLQRPVSGRVSNPDFQPSVLGRLRFSQVAGTHHNILSSPIRIMASSLQNS